ncbi:unnamed protein product [Allacma fusca]|uniref:Uncharacterized protein n=1 Tax=Allacma fusca TaxID=39272 RepID=A0A8J2LC63_9HEXA|nr:unnamed protein product [Allacma fusca]
MIRATAYVRKLVYVKTGRDLELTLNREDLHWAEFNWWKKVQNDSFGAEMRLLQQQKRLNASIRLYQLAVFLDNEGFIRVRGSPNMCGAWERLVRSVKLALQVTLKERVPREDVLLTLLVEAEAVVNSRPLTFVSVDANDPETLTPNHFLLGKK